MQAAGDAFTKLGPFAAPSSPERACALWLWPHKRNGTVQNYYDFNSCQRPFAMRNRLI